MLLALWPLVIAFPQQRGITGHIERLEKQSQKNIARTRARLQAEEAQLVRLQAEASDGANAARNADQRLDMGSVSSGVEPIGNVAVRIPRYERPLPRSVPTALGASITARDAISSELDAAMRLLVQRQAMDEDEEDAMIILTLMMEM